MGEGERFIGILENKHKRIRESPPRIRAGGPVPGAFVPGPVESYSFMTQKAGIYAMRGPWKGKLVQQAYQGRTGDA